MEDLEGRHARRSLAVEDRHTARALGSGDLDVLGTPAVLALAEEAAVAAIAPALADGQTSVGVHVALDHVKATAVGATVAAEARVTAADDGRVHFEIVVHEGEETVATAEHTRAIVDRARFLQRLS